MSITLTEMRDVAAAEARRIEVTQEALVKAELRQAPDQGELHRMAVFDAIVRLIDACQGNRTIMGELRNLITGKKAS